MLWLSCAILTCLNTTTMQGSETHKSATSVYASLPIHIAGWWKPVEFGSIKNRKSLIDPFGVRMACYGFALRKIGLNKFVINSKGKKRPFPHHPACEESVIFRRVFFLKRFSSISFFSCFTPNVIFLVFPSHNFYLLLWPPWVLSPMLMPGFRNSQNASSCQKLISKSFVTRYASGCQRFLLEMLLAQI